MYRMRIAVRGCPGAQLPGQQQHRLRQSSAVGTRLPAGRLLVALLRSTVIYEYCADEALCMIIYMLNTQRAIATWTVETRITLGSYDALAT